MKPDILLLDEPASALDPISTGTVEETLVQLKENYTIIIVTHNMRKLLGSVTILPFSIWAMLLSMTKQPKSLRDRKFKQRKIMYQVTLVNISSSFAVGNN